MKASDWIAGFLLRHVGHVFTLQGGAVAHLIDSCERIGPHPVYCHHEQAAAFAAGAYSRIKGYGCCIVTTGPGGTNAITPILGAWQDSVPMLVISGQTRLEHTSYGKAARQIGMQEAPICALIEPITKFNAVVTDAADIPFLFAKAVTMSIIGRPGPVWIDLPQDISWSEMP
jgi:acetolactate synthase-1/2/3 large subunit